jgi:hypothetical protein
MLDEIKVNKNKFKLEMTNFFMNYDFTKFIANQLNMNDVNCLIIKVIEKIEELSPNINLSNYHLLNSGISFLFELETQPIIIDVDIVSGRKILFRWK